MNISSITAVIEPYTPLPTTTSTTDTTTDTTSGTAMPMMMTTIAPILLTDTDDVDSVDLNNVSCNIDCSADCCKQVPTIVTPPVTPPPVEPQGPILYKGHPWYFCPKRGGEYGFYYEEKECFVTSALGNTFLTTKLIPPKKARLYNKPETTLSRSREYKWLSRNKYR